MLPSLAADRAGHLHPRPSRVDDVLVYDQDLQPSPGKEVDRGELAARRGTRIGRRREQCLSRSSARATTVQKPGAQTSSRNPAAPVLHPVAHKACCESFTVLYARCSTLLRELELAPTHGTYGKRLARRAKTDLSTGSSGPTSSGSEAKGVASGAPRSGGAR